MLNGLTRTQVLRGAVDLLIRAGITGYAAYKVEVDATHGPAWAAAIWAVFGLIFLIPLTAIVAGLLLGRRQRNVAKPS